MHDYLATIYTLVSHYNIYIIHTHTCILESRSVTITTFAKDRIQRRSNSSNSPQDEYEQVQEKVYYTQAPENVVIKV